MDSSFIVLATEEEARGLVVAEIHLDRQVRSKQCVNKQLTRNNY